MEREKSSDNVSVICVFPYCHSDWAWGHSRYWHANRYVKVLDEAIELIDKQSEFRFFFDSFVEFLPPFIKARREKIDRLAKIIEAGKIAIVGGQFCNLRPATAGEESFIRNIQLGRAEIRKLIPKAKFLGFANLDTAVGHSQLPQLLSQSEYKYYLFWRPEWGLDAQNVPRVFNWQGLDGSAILSARQCYAGLCSKDITPEPISENLDNIREQIIKQVKPFFEQAGLKAAIIYAGMDDALPLKDLQNDEPLAIFELIKLWNERFPEKMTFCTPDEFFSRIDISVIPEFAGVLDQADVCYNGPFGSNNLQPLRLRTESAIQYAEMMYAMFNRSSDAELEAKFDDLWRKLLTGTAHATQFLFDDDYRQLKLHLLDAESQANAITQTIAQEQFGQTPLHDSDSITLINPLPYEREEIISVPIVNVDLMKKSFAIFDENENLPAQFGYPKNPHRLAEVDALIKVKLPAAGYKQLKIVGDNKPISKPKLRELPMDYELQTPNANIIFDAGRITSIKVDNNKIIADTGIFELEIMRAKSSADPVMDSDGVSSGWMTAGLELSDEKFNVTKLRLMESGHFRCTIQRILESDKHRAVQLIHIYEDGVIECNSQIFAAAENVMVGISFPYDSKGKLISGIPFGWELRNLDDIPYQSQVEGNSIERLISGMFWIYDWLINKTKKFEYGVITPFGDRYWLRPNWNKKEILHLLVRSYELFVEPMKWEYHSCINRATTGLNEFTHILVADKSKLTESSMPRLKQRYVFPVTKIHSKHDEQQSSDSFVKLTPGNIRMTAFRKIAGEIECRLVESEGKATTAILEFQNEIRFAREINLAERYIGSISANGKRIEIKMQPYRIRTIRIAFMPDDVLPDEPVGNLEIISLEEADFSALMRFYNSLELPAIEKYRPFGWVTTEQALRRGTFARLKENKEISLVIKDDTGNIWGHSFIIIWDDKNRPPTFGIGLHQALRGKGLGKKIMQKILSLADDVYKLDRIGLTVLKSNERAANLYQNLGFELIEEFDAHDDEFTYLRMIRKRVER